MFLSKDPKLPEEENHEFFNLFNTAMKEDRIRHPRLQDTEEPAMYHYKDEDGGSTSPATWTRNLICKISMQEISPPIASTSTTRKTISDSVKQMVNTISSTSHQY